MGDIFASHACFFPPSNHCATRASADWDRLYPSEGWVEICNNLVENAIRPTKRGAKNWLFIGNEMSGQKCAILYTIVENCRRLGINPKE
jgi:hypothetical protein